MSTLDDFKENDLIQSVYDEAKNRMRSIMWGTFVISWCLWNWEVIYTTIFVDQAIIFEQTKLFKIEYILQHYYSWKTIGSTLWNFCKLGFGPALSTYFIIYQISKLDLIIFKQSYKNKIAQKNAALKLDKDILAKEEKNVIEKGKILKNQKKNILQEKQIKENSNEIKWEQEYMELKKKGLFTLSMNILEKTIYENHGSVDMFANRVEPRYLRFLHLNGIINFKGTSSIELTEKGKFFLNKYTN